MDPIEIRLEALKASISRASAMTPVDDVVSNAMAFYRFLRGVDEGFSLSEGTPRTSSEGDLSSDVPRPQPQERHA